MQPRNNLDMFFWVTSSTLESWMTHTQVSKLFSPPNWKLRSSYWIMSPRAGVKSDKNLWNHNLVLAFVNVTSLLFKKKSSQMGGISSQLKKENTSANNTSPARLLFRWYRPRLFSKRLNFLSRKLDEAAAILRQADSLTTLGGVIFSRRCQIGIWKKMVKLTPSFLG